MTTYYQNPTFVNHNWDFAATTDPKAAAANQLKYQTYQWNNGFTQGAYGPYGIDAPPKPTAASAQPVAVDMSLAKNGAGLGLSEQTMANMLSTYQAGGGTGSATVRPYQMTSAEQKALGIGSDMSFLANFDPSKPNWNAQSWQVSKPAPSGGMFDGLWQAALTVGLPAMGASFLGPSLGAAGSAAGDAAAAGIGSGISDAATQAAIDSIMGNTTGMIGANLAGAGFDVGAGLGVAGASTGLLGSSSPLPQGAFTPGADISSGYGFQPGADISSGYGFQPGADISSGYPAAQGGYAAGTNPYIGNSISDLAVTNPTGTVPTNSLFQNAQAALGGNYSTAAGNPLSGLVSNGSGILGSGGTNVATDSLIPGISNTDLLGGGLKLIGGIVGGNAATDAAKTAADAQLQAAKIAADAAKFKPVGVTTNFGKSQFGYDANGNLTSAGYQLSPQLQAQQNQIMAGTNPLLTQALGAQAATAPMGDAAQRMMTLGNGYLASTPQEQAAKWLADQRALLTQGDQSNYAALQAQLQASGRGGLMTGGGNGFAAANPELNAYYNAMQQRDLGLAANATQQGQQYASYGANLVGGGGDMLNSMYGVQSAAYNPYKTALGQASTIEGLGQNALDQGINLGAKGTAATAQSGMLLGQGMSNAAQTMQQANAYSPWATGLSNLGNLFQQSGAQAQPQGYQFNPYTGKSLLG
jgi:hypothetical protein